MILYDQIRSGRVTYRKLRRLTGSHWSTPEHCILISRIWISGFSLVEKLWHCTQPIYFFYTEIKLDNIFSFLNLNRSVAWSIPKQNRVQYLLSKNRRRKKLTGVNWSLNLWYGLCLVHCAICYANCYLQILSYSWHIIHLNTEETKVTQMFEGKLCKRKITKKLALFESFIGKKKQNG